MLMHVDPNVYRPTLYIFISSKRQPNIIINTLKILKYIHKTHTLKPRTGTH